MGLQKYNIEIVREIFKDGGCELISSEYKSTKIKLDYICSCGELNEIKLEKFLKGQRCRKCSYIKSASKLRLDYNEVKDYFEINNCKLISDTYLNSTSTLEYICSCGNESTIAYCHFKKGVRCSKCAGNEKLDYNYVKDYFESKNCKLISNEYVNSNSKLDYICECGNESSISYSEFKRGRRCVKCKSIKIGNIKRLSYEEVKSVFVRNGMELISDTYVNIYTHLEYKCVCGNIGNTCYPHIRNGGKCQECRKKLISKLMTGENNHRYKNVTKKERLNNRNYFEYKNWRISVFKRDNYTCQCCGSKGGKLNAHHIDSYDWCIERRHDESNGSTLCEFCHILFHKTYGFGNNTESQYEDFLIKYYNGEFKEYISD